MIFILALALLSITFFAGFLGALLGIGGGAILVPMLTTFVGIPVKEAIAASLVCATATSVASSRSYISQNLVNLRLALFLETGAAMGAMLGAFLAAIASSAVLHIALGSTLMVIAGVQFKNVKAESHTTSLSIPRRSEDFLAKTLKLSSSYYDPNLRRVVNYEVVNSQWGLMIALLAGMLSSAVGIGGGAIKVPIMNRIMGIPIKASIATSAFMVGLTSSIGVIAYLTFGLLNLEMLPLMVIGTVLGSTMGSKVMKKVKSSRLLLVFALLLVFLAYTVLSKGVQMMLSI